MSQTECPRPLARAGAGGQAETYWQSPVLNMRSHSKRTVDGANYQLYFNKNCTMWLIVSPGITQEAVLFIVVEYAPHKAYHFNQWLCDSVALVTGRWSQERHSLPKLFHPPKQTLRLLITPPLPSAQLLGAPTPLSCRSASPKQLIEVEACGIRSSAAS